MKSTFIVLEGPDGAGTTLQSKLLAERLRAEGRDVLLTAEPTDGGIGKHIRSILSQETLPPPDAIQLLFCADRAQHVAEEVLPALESGKTVISDRYALSTIIYGTALGLDTQWLEQVNAMFPKPDITVLTLPPFAVCMKRLAKRAERDAFEKEDFLQKIYSLYDAIDNDTTIKVDTSGEKEESANVVYNSVMNL